jgi:hypothetical protein
MMPMMVVVVVTTRTRMQKLEKCMYSSAYTCLASYNSTQTIKAAKEKYPASNYTYITPQLEATKHVILSYS